MKRWFLAGIMLLLVPLLLVSCGMPQEDYDAVVAERDITKKQITSLQNGLTASQAQIQSLQDDLTEAQAQIQSLVAVPTYEEPSQFFYPAPEIFINENVKYPFTFIVYGDSRELAGDEKDALIAQVIRENPSFVLHLGDLVHYGEEHQWRIFDLFDGQIINAGIPLYPVLGNHEYDTREENHPPDTNEQLQHYFNRFKFLENYRWYSFIYGNSRFLMLDTNTDYSAGSEQYNWFTKELIGEDLGFLFIAFHHPSYSGYYTSGAGKEVANIIESYNDKGFIKADIVFSGHIHNYQRFEKNGINFVVSGGGGAPLSLIDRRADDLFNGEVPTYHYNKITVSESEVSFQMIELDESTGTWRVADTFEVKRT